MNSHLLKVVITFFCFFILLSQSFAADVKVGLETKDKVAKTDPYVSKSEVERLKVEISTLKSQMAELRVEKKASEALSTIAEKNLKAPEIWYDSVNRLILAISAMIGAGIGILFEIVRRLIKDFKNNLTGDFDKLKGEVQTERKKFLEFQKESERGIYELLGKAKAKDGVDAFYKSNINLAIVHGEKSADYFEKAYGKSPEDPNEKYTLADARSNLAYYYAADNRTEKTGLTMNYAEEGLILGRDFGDIDMIDNFLFVFMKWGASKEQKYKWIQTYENFEERLGAYKKLTLEELQEYKKFYESLKPRRSEEPGDPNSR